VRALRGIIGKAEMVVAGKSQTNPIRTISWKKALLRRKANPSDV
jgi:hypothetical protein